MNAAGPNPPGGVLKGGTHVLPVRVYYEDTDASGIVYHGSYLRFAERGRTEMLRAMGIELAQLREKDGLVFVVRKGEMHYFKPATVDDRLAVRTALAKLGGASVHLNQAILRVEDGDGEDEELFRFNVHVACMGRDGKAVRLPPDLRSKLEALL